MRLYEEDWGEGRSPFGRQAGVCTRLNRLLVPAAAADEVDDAHGSGALVNDHASVTPHAEPRTCRRSKPLDHRARWDQMADESVGGTESDRYAPLHNYCAV